MFLYGLKIFQKYLSFKESSKINIVELLLNI